MKVAQGVMLPDRSTAPLYVQYNDFLLQGTPEDVLQGIHNHHWTNYQKLHNTIEDDQDSKGFF